MKTHQSKLFKLGDYKILDHFMTHVDLMIDLTKKPILSKSTLRIEPNPESQQVSLDLVLDGENMSLESIFLDERKLSAKDYVLTQHSIIIKNIPQKKSFTLTSTTYLGENTDLFGLYETEGTILIKAETEGLRRVFFCLDRPDNLATYKTTIIAQKEDYPILLSNGSLVERKDLPDGMHLVIWLDNVPKPSYLFALVAGKLEKSVTFFKSISRRELPIEFYVPPAAMEKCEFAKEVLKAAMRWDEEVFKLECDLPQHMVAGVDKYASGASEPTGLNLFNTANLYATPQIKTDIEILRVLEVVAHEFYHYWSGDRVTIRDWFNLPFKEGLTTFRAAMFREQLFGSDLVRILDGKNLDERAPRQSSYTNVRSLYTAAAYEKSAHIFRMMMLFLGETNFYAAMSQFLRDHDGKAVTLENVLDSLSHLTGKDLHPFLNWFTESGIPQVKVTDHYDFKEKKYTLEFQTQDDKKRPIPIVMGLLNEQGEEIQSDITLIINQPKMEFHFENIPHPPVPSLLRSFSAPIYIDYAHNERQLMLLMQYDVNMYNRCEAAKKLITQIVDRYCSGHPLELSSDFFATYNNITCKKNMLENYWLFSEQIALPSEDFLCAALQNQSFEKIAEAHRLIQKQLAEKLQDNLLSIQNHIYHLPEIKSSPFSSFNIFAAGIRRIKHVCHTYLYSIQPKKTEEVLIKQFNDELSKNMTEAISALSLLLSNNSSKAKKLLEKFYEFGKDDPGIVNHWFSMQAAVHYKDVLKKVKQLMLHPAFDFSNPNKVYALLGTFIRNHYGFHDESGKGYRLITEAILKIETINPSLAANLAEKFNSWDKYNKKRQEFMLRELEFIRVHSITNDVKNMVNRGLSKKKA